MTAHLILESASDSVLSLVADFARGLGYGVELLTTEAGRAIRVQLPDAGDLLLDLISHVGLATAKAGVAADEPLCRVIFRHGNAKAEVTMGLRLAEFAIVALPAEPMPS